MSASPFVKIGLADAVFLGMVLIALVGLQLTAKVGAF